MMLWWKRLLLKISAKSLKVTFIMGKWEPNTWLVLLQCWRSLGGLHGAGGCRGPVDRSVRCWGQKWALAVLPPQPHCCPESTAGQGDRTGPGLPTFLSSPTLSFHLLSSIRMYSSRKQEFELDMEQQTGSKLGKEYVKAVYCHPAYLTYMQSTSWETLGWMKHKLKSRLLGEISITSDMQVTPPLWQKEKKNWRASGWKWESGKVGLKLNIQKTKIMASGPITSWQIDG